MTTYRVIHRTSYRYGAAMTDGYTVACLVPRPTEWQTVVDSEVRLVPEASERDSYIDAFGNLVNQFGLHVPHDEMAVEAVSVVDVANRPMPVDATPWEEVADAVERLAGPLAVEVGVYRASSTLVDTTALTGDLRSIADGVFEPGRPIVEAAAALCTAIFSGFEFDSGFSDVSTPLDEVLRERRGVCQDFAHLAIGCLRAMGLADALRERLHRDGRSIWRAQTRRRRRVPRVVFGVDAERRLGRLRPDERAPAGQRPRHGGVGPRLRRCHAGSGCDDRPRDDAGARRVGRHGPHRLRTRSAGPDPRV